MKFVTPSLLFALSFVIVPILIHLFNLRKYKTVYFSNVRFLKELKQQTKKQSRLKHILVLLSRIFFIVFLVLAFAQPYISKNTEVIITEKDFVSIFIDNSFSMEAESENGILLQTAKTKALEIINSHRITDDFNIIDNNFAALNQRNFNKEELQNIIQKTDFSFHFRFLSDIYDRQKSLASGQQYKQRFFYFISDFQKNFVNIDKIKTDSIDKVFFIPLTPNETHNLYIDSCWFETPSKRIEQNIILKASIFNNSNETLEKIPVKLFVNNQQRALTSFDINPNSETIIELPYKITDKGINHAYLEISDYPVTYDDKFYFSYTVDDNINILCINNKIENVYINALFKTDSIFALKNANAGAVDYSRLNNYSLIILNEFDEIASGLANELLKYIKEGGTLFIIPGTNINTDSYNTFFSQATNIKINNTDNQILKINKINFTHPLYSNVFEKIPENISLPEVSKHYPFSSSTNSLSESLLFLQNGNPFLSKFLIEKGQLYLIACPLNKSFTNFPQHSIFVPTLYNMALYSNTNTTLYYLLGTDNAISVNNKNADLNKVFKIKNTNNNLEFIPQFNNSFQHITFQLNGMPEEAGNFNILNKNEILTGISFNYNRKESDLSYYKNDEINKLIKDNNLHNVFLLNSQKESIGNAITKINQGVLLWKYCIILALLFLLIEALLLRFLK